jgi:hypothetical protein
MVFSGLCLEIMDFASLLEWSSWPVQELGDLAGNPSLSILVPVEGAEC